jgi:acyl-homoserine-lactone acylase
MGYGSGPQGPSFARALGAGPIVAAAAITALILSAPPARAATPSTVSGATASGGHLEATILRDQHGIPNIIGQNFADVGFGYGYAFAQDNICTIAESYVTVRGERSRYSGSGVEGTFGPDGSYPQRGNGFAAHNLNSDFFYQRIIDKQIVEHLLDEPPPNGPVPEIKQGVAGYVAGYDKYLADTGVNNLPDPRCRGADWVKPITEMDAYRRFYQLALLASQTVAIDGIASEKTPGGVASPLSTAQTAAGLDGALGQLPIGSNAYGLGSQATQNGHGMVLANPHFPWDGPERFYQAHLVIPGQVNVSGASLYGVPLILIGHTDGLAWSHTVSTAFRFTPFEETINPANPTQYLYDGQWRNMNQDQVTIQVRSDSGLEPRTRTIYSTHHGPVMDSLSGIPLPWTPATAFTMGDVNAGNFRYLNHYFFTNQAQNVDEYDQIERRYQGIPWVNSIAADSAGHAYYADIGAIPNVSNQKAAACDTPIGDATFAAIRLPILNGATSACEWDNDPDAAAPGTFGPSHEPSLKLDSYVTNSNDSYWLSNPDHPLTGFARIIGDENTPRSLRTRLGLRIVQQRLDGSDGEAGTGFTRQVLQDAVFNNRQYAGELWRDQLVGLCQSAPGGQLMGSNGPVDVSGACPVLAAWDRHDNLDSNGAILFRRFASRALSNPASPVTLPTGDLTAFSTPFSPADPVNTPSGLNIASPKVQQALADAVTDLQNAGIPLGAPLRGYQYEKRGSERIPIHGGPGTLGVFNAINVSWRGSGSEPGYPDVPHGSSFVMVTSFTGGCPDDRSILTYSESSNPDSPYSADQTRMFSNKEWVDPDFCLTEVQNDPSLTPTEVQGCLPQGCKPAKPPKHRKYRKAKRHKRHRKH